MHFSVHRFAPIHIHPPLGGTSCEATGTLKRTQFFHNLNMLNILITWNLNFNIISPRELTHTDKNPNKLKNAHFSPHLCPKLIFNITYLKKTKSRHRGWPTPYFYTQITWVWHIPKYEDNHTENFFTQHKMSDPSHVKVPVLPKTKCQILFNFITH